VSVDNVSDLLDQIKAKQATIHEVEEESAVLHDALIGKLKSIAGQSLLLAASPTDPAVTPEPSPVEPAVNPEASPGESAMIPEAWNSEVDAWRNCEDQKTALQLEVNQCEAGLIADETRQKLDQASRAQDGDQASARAEMLKQKLKLLEEQLSLAKARLERLQEQIMKVEQMQRTGGLPVALQDGPLVSGLVASESRSRTPGSLSFLHASSPVDADDHPPVEESAREALRRAQVARDAAAAAHEEAISEHRQAAKVAERSHGAVAAVAQKTREVREYLSLQNKTLSQAMHDASESKSAVEKAQARIDEVRAEVDRLGNKSHDAFLKAFVVEHKHGESKKQLLDGIVEARIATSRWEHNQQKANEVQFNVSRLEDLDVSLGWKLKKTRLADEKAQADAAAANMRLEESAKTLDEKERRVKSAADVLEDPSHSGTIVTAAGTWIVSFTAMLTILPSL
jgi:hypothetical protein